MDFTLFDLLLFLIFGGIGVLLSGVIFHFKWSGKEKDLQNRNRLLQSEADHAKEQLERLKSSFDQQAEKTEQNFYRRIEEMRKEREAIRWDKEQYRIDLERRNTEYSALKERLERQKEELEGLQHKFHLTFENLARTILEKESEKFTNLNKENIESLLKPLRERILNFEQKVELNEKASVKRHAELGEQLRFLNQQNIKISEEAVNLTRALKGNAKVQGNWGEMILERVLEGSGLERGREYSTQEHVVTVDGKRLQPDVVIHLPGDRKMIVDAKVSLTAYERYVNATDEKTKDTFLKAHLASLEKHVEELSQKSYQRVYQQESPNFVLLFIPIEAAFAVASNAYPQLYAKAFDRQIILVTPTTLLAVLRTVESMWQNEKQTQNATEIAAQAGRLYDSFVNLTLEFEKVGKQLGTLQRTYDSAMKKLTGRGNLIRRVEKLKKLGVQTAKQMDRKYLQTAEEEE